MRSPRQIHPANRISPFWAPLLLRETVFSLFPQPRRPLHLQRLCSTRGHNGPGRVPRAVWPSRCRSKVRALRPPLSGVSLPEHHMAATTWIFEQFWKILRVSLLSSSGRSSCRETDDEILNRCEQSPLRHFFREKRNERKVTQDAITGHITASTSIGQIPLPPLGVLACRP
ncbi:hypothetical protein N657DRAFT_290903 [Parathielavia appendiculata]|uniref:Uncharacterized protein n=1 Tax=Parathielavia appendiculata TaxID=2587402 RepID=A0AAN6U416_9PEZI|nr:hypothetical protein N657DRAFT_290903 [Parathielavia appendiculata]